MAKIINSATKKTDINYLRTFLEEAFAAYRADVQAWESMMEELDKIRNDARNGSTDTVTAHDPEEESRFLSETFLKDKRKMVFYNKFVLPCLASF